MDGTDQERRWAKSRQRLWHRIDASQSPRSDEVEYLQRIHEFSEVGGQDSPDDVAELVAAILDRCDEEFSDESEYLENGQPTAFFYDTVLAWLESRDERSQESSSEEDIEDEPDEDLEDEPEAEGAVKANVRTMGIDAIRSLVDWGSLDLNPPWQRSDVWSTAKKRELIKSLLLGIPIPSIILHQGGDEQYSVIDGKQRLNAIVMYLKNEFKLPNFKVEPGHPLYASRGCWYDKPGRGRRLGAKERTRIVTTQIPVLQFENVAPSRLRKIFQLYNVSSVRLNPAEIRNAVYQTNPVHQALFILAGENLDRPRLEFLDDTTQHQFTEDLRHTLNRTARYAALDFLCRYLGYSRATAEPGKPLRPGSTAKIVDKYFDLESTSEEPRAVVKEIVRVFARAPEIFDIEINGEMDFMAFFRRDKEGERKFNALVAVTSMVCTRVVDAVAEDSGLDDETIREAVLRTLLKERYPESQSSATIWGYQARVFLRLMDELGTDLSEAAEGRFAHFSQKMQQVRDEPEE